MLVPVRHKKTRQEKVFFSHYPNKFSVGSGINSKKAKYKKAEDR
jgi:hypothetical protein